MKLRNHHSTSPRVRKAGKCNQHSRTAHTALRCLPVHGILLDVSAIGTYSPPRREVFGKPPVTENTWYLLVLAGFAGDRVHLIAKCDQDVVIHVATHAYIGNSGIVQFVLKRLKRMFWYRSSS